MCCTTQAAARERLNKWCTARAQSLLLQAGGNRMQQAHLITAPGDGIGPAVLLSLGASSGGGGGSGRPGSQPPPPQYLFNVPEGFARLVLEHKLRPGDADACD